MEFDLPGNRQRQYYDMNRTYLEFDAVNNGAAALLDSSGAMAFIKQFVIETPSATLFNCNNWNVLASALLDQDSSPAWRGSYGNVMLGTYGDAQRGETIGAGGSRKFCVPLCLNPLAMSSPHRLIPGFSLAPIQIKLTLESDAKSTHNGGAVFTFKNVRLVTYVTELSQGAQDHLDQATGGIYNMLCSTYNHASSTLSAGTTSLTPTLGFSMSSLERIICLHRKQSSQIALAYSIGSRATAGLVSYQYLINGEQYPQKAISVGGKGAEAMAELLIGDHSLQNFTKGCGLQNGFARVTNTTSGGGMSMLSGVDPGAVKYSPFSVVAPVGTTAGSVTDAGVATASNVGTFIATVEMESSVSDGKSSHIYSGINTLGSVLQFNGEYVAQPDGYDVDFFAQSTVVIGLDMRGTAMFTVQV